MSYIVMAAGLSSPLWIASEDGRLQLCVDRDDAATFPMRPAAELAIEAFRRENVELGPLVFCVVRDDRR
jgi:hypothetical protein